MAPDEHKQLRDVFITEQLALRSAAPEERREQLALVDLAHRMLDEPEGILPALVDRAIDCCNAVAGGLSLLEALPPPGVFRWHHLRGSLAQFSGETIPRHFSPCGVILDEGRPILVQHPERAYNWLAEKGVSLPECLLVPLVAGGGQPVGTLWVVSEQVGRLSSNHARVLQELAAFAGIALTMVEKRRELESAYEREKLLAREMEHRVQNAFALADAIVRMSARSSSTPMELAVEAGGRLQALSAVQRNARIIDGELRSSIELKELIGTGLQPFVLAHVTIEVEGPILEVGPKSSTSFALILHELATNAVKYGALGNDHGKLAVTWSVNRDSLRLLWTERSPAHNRVTPPRSGFGLGLCERMAAQLGGSLVHSWDEAGLVVELVAPCTTLDR